MPCLPYGITSAGHALRVSRQAPFLYQVTPSKSCRLVAAMSSVGLSSLYINTLHEPGLPEYEGICTYIQLKERN